MGTGSSSVPSFSQEYSVLHGSQPQDHYYLLQHRESQRLYVGRELHCQDQDEAQDMEALLREKMHSASPYVTRLLDAGRDQEHSYCSSVRKFSVLFGHPGQLLAEEIGRRRASKQRFETG